MAAEDLGSSIDTLWHLHIAVFSHLFCTLAACGEGPLTSGMGSPHPQALSHLPIFSENVPKGAQMCLTSFRCLLLQLM